MNWIDISVPLQNSIVHWPSDPPFERTQVEDISKGDSANLSKLNMGSHSGTHVDAPRHFIQDGVDISQMPLDTMIGPARVIEIRDNRSIRVDELSESDIRRGERILFKTHNSSGIWERKTFVPDFVSLSKEAADFLAERKVRMVGIDYLSIGPYHGEGAYIHRTLLKAGVWIIEGLDLSQVKPGPYYLICLPLRIESGDGSPARAILRTPE